MEKWKKTPEGCFILEFLGQQMSLYTKWIRMEKNDWQSVFSLMVLNERLLYSHDAVHVLFLISWEMWCIYLYVLVQKKKKPKKKPSSKKSMRNGLSSKYICWRFLGKKPWRDRRESCYSALKDGKWNRLSSQTLHKIFLFSAGNEWGRGVPSCCSWL